MPAYIIITTVTCGSRRYFFNSEPHLAPLPELLMETAWQQAFDILDEREKMLRQEKDPQVTVTVSIAIHQDDWTEYPKRASAEPVTETRIMELRGLPFGSIAYPYNFHAINTSRHEYVMTTWYDLINNRWDINPTSHVIDTSRHKYDLTITIRDRNYVKRREINLPVIAPDLATASKLGWEYAQRQTEMFLYEEYDDYREYHNCIDLYKRYPDYYRKYGDYKKYCDYKECDARKFSVPARVCLCKEERVVYAEEEYIGTIDPDEEEDD
jgi:hypothetical protein